MESIQKWGKIIKRETECYCLTRNVLRYINRSLIPRTDGGLFLFLLKVIQLSSFLGDLCPRVNVGENKLAHLDEREKENICGKKKKNKNKKKPYLELRDLD